MSLITEFLTNNNFDYFVLPNSDEFFSEYVAQNQKRIQEISGFTGSNATIIFTKKKHYFFTDGRYLLQAKNQIDLSKYEIINIADISVISWLKNNLKFNSNLAIDPRLTSKKFIEECEKFIPKITFLQENPIKIKDQNSTKKDKIIFKIPDHISGESFASKRNRIISQIQYDGIFISKPENLNWLLNIRGNDINYTPIFLAHSVLLKNGKLIIFSNINLFENFVIPEDVEIVEIENIKSNLNNYLPKKSTLQTDFATTNFWIYELFENQQIKLIDNQCPIELTKAVKNKIEIEGAIKSHNQDAVAMIKFLYWLNHSVNNNSYLSEFNVAEKLLEFRKQSKDFQYPSFDTIAGFAGNGAIIHYKATESNNQEITQNNLLLIDSGGQYLGDDFMGTTDITRTICIGKPSDDMIEDYTRVLKGHINLARTKFPNGTTGANLDTIARFHLWNDAKDYEHGTGHGVGAFASVHEGPFSISRKSQFPIKENVILSNEPGYYKANEYGIRLENLMVSQKYNDKMMEFKILSLVPFELKMINFKMLTYPEKKWLGEYHQKIIFEIGELLEYTVFNWLCNNYSYKEII
ncbi:MAG: M24 family metallopeptidase [Rickettsiales bacterium]